MTLESDVDLIPCNLGNTTSIKEEGKAVCLNAVYVLTCGEFEEVMERKVTGVQDR
jgi:hypothetical protein